jgi:hypothetical protein
MADRYYYRGTTVGWPGDTMLQDQKTTCTTTDPLVATLFAIECRNYGRAVVLAARRDSFGSLIGPANYFDMIESAVNLLCPPLEFERQVDFFLDVDIELLRELGFPDMPVRLSGKTILQQELEETHSLGMRLNKDQVTQFDARMQELSHGRERT